MIPFPVSKHFYACSSSLPFIKQSFCINILNKQLSSVRNATVFDKGNKKEMVMSLIYSNVMWINAMGTGRGITSSYKTLLNKASDSLEQRQGDWWLSLPTEKQFRGSCCDTRGEYEPELSTLQWVYTFPCFE